MSCSAETRILGAVIQSGCLDVRAVILAQVMEVAESVRSNKTSKLFLCGRGQVKGAICFCFSYVQTRRLYDYYSTPCVDVIHCFASQYFTCLHTVTKLCL